MLNPVIDIVDIDLAGRVITIRDITGIYDAVNNPGGYGLPNATKGSVQGIVVTLSHYSSDEVWQSRYVREADPLHPEYILSPAVPDILDQIPLKITSLSLGITEPEEGIKSFNDGVLDLNYYPYVEPVTVVGETGNPYVTGEGLDAIWELDSVLIGDTIYPINHSMGTNGGLILFLLKDLEEDVTELSPMYRANTKVFMDKQSYCGLSKNSAKLAAGGGCKGGCGQLKRNLLTIKHSRDAAVLDFYAGDFKAANSKLTEAARATGKLNCGC